MTVITVGLVLLTLYLGSMVSIIQFKGDTSIANFTWGGGVMLVALYTLFTISLFSPRQLLITSLITLWALRLAFYLYIRYTGKDPRFATWKWQGLKALVINISWVVGQTVLIAVMGYPALLVNISLMPALTIIDCIGIAVWLLGFIYESISDYQLLMFMRNPANKGHVMQFGLWHYSRHPNYFGEILMWWGIFIITLSVPNGWTTIISPLTITTMLLFITGIPWVEKAMANNLEYQAYKQKTSACIPWFVKE